ncbi:MAG: VOC family protein [Actinomycetes bacterium]
MTFGVGDVKRSKAFYRALGWEAAVDMEEFAVFRTAGALLAIYPMADLSRDMGDVVPAGHPRRTSLAINVGSAEEVDEVVARALAAGAGLLSAPETAAWGGYTAIVADPDGHAWEVAHNPDWPLGADGLPTVP